MLIRLLLLINIVAGSVCYAFDTKIYFDQNQHTAFHAFGNDGSNIISHCSLNFSGNNDGRCYFDFEDGDRNRFNILVSYDDLKFIHPQLLNGLKNLRDEWKKNHPVNFLNQFLFAQDDHDFLDSMIEKLEKENLPLRVLFPKKPRDVEQFWSGELMRRVMELYADTLKPYDMRNQMPSYGDAKSEEEAEETESSVQ